MLNILKKSFSVFVALTTILWALGPFSIFVNQAKAAASTAVTFSGCGGIDNNLPCYNIPAQGQVVPVSSQALGLFTFHIRKTSAATLTNVKVNLIGSGTVTASDISALAVYKRPGDDYSTGGMYSFPNAHKIGEQTVIADFAAGVSANTISITQDGTKNAIPAEFYGSTGAEYYVAIKTSGTWGSGSQEDQVYYTLSADWITVAEPGSATLGVACPVSGAACQPVGDKYYAVAPTGWSGSSFAIENVNYMGLIGMNKEVEVNFTTEVEETSAETVANYAISSTAPTSVMKVSPDIVRLTFASSVTITPNQSSLTIKGPGGATVNGKVGVQSLMTGSVLTADVNMMIMGGGGGGMAMPILISEVMIGASGTGGGLKEFIELYNSSPSSIDFSLMPIKVWVITSSGTAITHTKIKDLTTGSIPARGYYLIASQTDEYPDIIATPDATYDASLLGHATEGALKANSGIYVSTSNSQNIGVIDRLGWGSALGEMSQGSAKCSSTDPAACAVANDGKSLERKANPSSTVTSMTSGTDVLNGNSYTSMNNQYDFIQRTTAGQQNTSNTESPGGVGFGIQNTAPTIAHQPLASAVATQDLIAIAEFMDDSGQLSAANLRLYYRFHSPQGAWNPVSATQTSSGSNVYRFTIPSATLDANKDLDYFLRATDNTYYTCLPPGGGGPSSSCDATTNLIPSTATPFYINVAATGGTGVISGFVRDSSSVGIPNVMVYTESMPFTTTTNSSGAFTLSGLPGGIYDVKARGGSYTVNGATANYFEGWLSGMSINSNNQTSSGNIITLVQGAVETYTGGSADTESPWVKWSAPNDQMQGFPKAGNLIVVFDRAMQSSTINDDNATTTADNIYLVDAGGTVVPGAVNYYPTNTDRPTNTPSDPYLMIYNPSFDLTPGSDYTLVLKDTVLGSNGKRLMGNRPSGGQTIKFTAAYDFGVGGVGGANSGTYSFGTGASFPAYVTGTSPGPGAFSVPLNTKINISFNESMSSSSISTTNIKIYTVANPFKSNETETAFVAYVVTQNTAGNIAILTPTSNLTASAHYRVKVLSNCTSANGTPMSQSNNGEMFRIDFDAAALTWGNNGLDNVAPTVAGTYPNNSDTGIPNNLPAVTIGFSESMDVSTINTKTVQIKRGTNPIAGVVEYDVGSREARFMPANALMPGASYTIQIVSGSSGVKDLAGNALAANYTASFTTDSTADSTAPTIQFARCDDFSCSITFSEPMNNSRADDSTNFAFSVLNKNNYNIIRVGDLAETNQASNARAEYDQMNNSVRLENISGLASGNQSQVTVTNIKDRAGNAISTSNNANRFTGPVESSRATGGSMGPGGPGPMMGPSTVTVGPGGGTSMGGSMGFDFGGQWEKPTNVMPMNMTAGATTRYMVSFPATTAIPPSGSIVLTFPSGFDVTNAAAVATTDSMANKDLNGPGSGTVTIVSVTKNTTSRTVTVTTTGGALAANDYVMLDLKLIKNSTVARGFDTNGYTVDVKTKNDLGVLLESLTSFPFFINASGNYILSGTITAASATGGTATVYLGSPMTGPMETTVTFASGTASYSFTGLVEGNYNLFTEPSITLTNGDYVGYMKPEPIFINSANCTPNSTCTKNFSFTKQDTNSAYALTVRVVGNFADMSATDRNIDIFAGGQNGNSVKTVTLDAQNYTAGSPYSTTLYLTGTGEWWVGLGPAMPKGGMMMGPPPMPAWMPPAHQQLNITAGTAYGNVGVKTFTITTAANQIIGYVVDGSGNAIANVDVDGHRTQGGFGMPSHATTESNGKFTLKVSTGIYEINAWMPGMPWSPGRVVDVRDDGVYKNNGTTLVTDSERLLIKLDKSSTTISGKLLDNNGNPVGYAPVWAYSSTTGDYRPSGTDSSGNYTIYAGNGNWNVEAHVPGIGDVSYTNNPVSVSGSNRSGIDIRPSSSTTFYTVSGTVTIANNAVSNASVWVDRGTYHNQTNTNSSGAYRLTVPANSGYSLKCWTPDYGELTPVTVNASTGNVSQNFTITAATMKTLTVNFTGSSNLKSGTEAFLDVFKPGTGGVGGRGNHKRIDDLSNASSTTISIPADSGYEIHMFIPGIGNINPTCQADGTNATCTAGSNNMPDFWTINENASVAVNLTALGDLYTFTITILNASSTAISDAFAWLDSSSFHNGSPTNASGVATLKVPAGTYKLGGDKPGFTSPAPAAMIAGGTSDNLAAACDTYTVGTKTCAKTINFASNPYTLSGTILNASSGAVADAWVWAEKVTSATNLAFTGGWTGAKANADGTYQLSISNGWWLVKAVADGYTETAYTVSGTQTGIQVNGANVTGKNITLASRSNYTAVAPKSAPITPASGGTIDDSANTGVKLIIPPSVLGTDTSSGTVSIKDTYSVPKTSTMSPLGGKGKTINATNSSGQAVTSLTGSATIEITYSESDIPSGKTESQILLAYYDNSSNQWVQIPAAIDTTNNTVSGSTTHFSDIALVIATSSIAAPTGLTAAAASTSQINLSWTQVSGATSYDIYRSATSGGVYYRVGSEPTVSSGSTTTYSDTNLTAATTYYYKISSLDSNGEGLPSSAVSGTTSTAGGGGVPITPTEPVTPTEPTTPTTPSKPVSEMTISEIKAKIAEIIALISNLKSQLKTTAKAVFTLPLKSKSRGDEVKKLQASLISQGFLKKGLDTGWFGPLTKTAVIKFQAFKGLAGDGVVGPKTRAELNKLLN